MRRCGYETREHRAGSHWVLLNGGGVKKNFGSVAGQRINAENPPIYLFSFILSNHIASLTDCSSAVMHLARLITWMSFSVPVVR